MSSDRTHSKASLIGDGAQIRIRTPQQPCNCSTHESNYPNLQSNIDDIQFVVMVSERAFSFFFLMKVSAKENSLVGS